MYIGFGPTGWQGSLSAWLVVQPGVVGSAAVGPLEGRAVSPCSCLLSPGGVRAGAGLLEGGARSLSGCLHSSMELGAGSDLLVGGYAPQC